MATEFDTKLYKQWAALFKKAVMKESGVTETQMKNLRRAIKLDWEDNMLMFPDEANVEMQTAYDRLLTGVSPLKTKRKPSMQPMINEPYTTRISTQRGRPWKISFRAYHGS